ncbi:MAG TPA: superoxide dismutase [Thermoplasmata archaeon]|jgi:Fe-Mn family superoxide dismutase
MEEVKTYSLPKLPYEYTALAPYISETQLRIHHEKHHNAYVTGANNLLAKIDKARAENADYDVKAALKELSWNVGGHVLHSLFWGNLAPKGKSPEKPGGVLGDWLNKEFGSFERFKKEFTQAASSVEGSGWAALVKPAHVTRPFIMQLEKHNVNGMPGSAILMVVDVFEHAYYIDYKNDRGKFLEAFWNIVNWDEVEKRLQAEL